MLLHHQEFANNFISPDNNNRSVLLLFSTGAGKSFTTISICDSFVNSNLYGYYEYPIIIGKSDITNLNFKKQVELYNKKYSRKMKMKYKIIFKTDNLKLNNEYRYILMYDKLHHVRKINKLYDKIKILKGVILFLTTTEYIDKVEGFYDIMDLLPQKNIPKYTNNECNVRVTYKRQNIGYKYPVMSLETSKTQKQDYDRIPNTSIRCEKVYETIMSNSLRTKIKNKISNITMEDLQIHPIKLYMGMYFYV